MIWLLIQLAIQILPLAVLIGPLQGLPRRMFWWAILVQIVLMAFWAWVGATVIGGLWWRAGGGCAGHGGSFEGTCGYAGVANGIISGYATACIMTLVCGIVFRIVVKRRTRS
ncbi:hypothetical protein EKE94_08785 [Mesobaculum littorinae]|uniref:Uncharacterized protein n=1 Tax=Mesobaculum littorinae TaxID=2486419 RepID=A0A438AJZ8_9RHOB|nr:hypothetical protein [Mesobaculum littorinae]RVV98966.1 hypothetical protein EKE94_08785 [Mesobaculum littorinae]